MTPLRIQRKRTQGWRMPPDNQTRCTAVIYKRDTYRYTGRGENGFELHYVTKRCARRAVCDGRCRQHNDRVKFMDYKFL